MTLHGNIPLGDHHIPYNWTYADATARAAASGLLAGDDGKLARQLDDDSLWMLTDYSVPTWTAVGGGSGGSSLWQRAGTELTTLNAGDDVTVDGVFSIQRSGSPIFQINAAGFIGFAPSSGQDFSVQTTGMGADILFNSGRYLDITATSRFRVDVGGTYSFFGTTSYTQVLAPENGNLNLTGANNGDVNLTCRDGTLSILASETADIEIGTYSSSGNIDINSGGWLSFKCDTAMAIQYDDDVGGNDFTVYKSGELYYMMTMDGDGGIEFHPHAGQNFTVLTAADNADAFAINDCLMRANKSSLANSSEEIILSEISGGPDDLVGILWVIVDSGGVAGGPVYFKLSGASSSVTLGSDVSTSVFSASKGTSSRINIYTEDTGSDGEYDLGIQNNSGSAIEIGWKIMFVAE